MGRVLVVGLVVLFALPIGAAQAATRSDGSTPISPHVVSLVENVPASTLNRVGAGIVSPQGPLLQGAFHVTRLHRALIGQGKPEVLAMFMAWCPDCASESWSLAVALSRFGTLSGLRAINSGTFLCKLNSTCSLLTPLCDANTHGLSFLDASYQSPYLSFVPVVVADVNGNPVERPTRQENVAIGRFDPHGNFFPVADVGGAYGFTNAGYDPGILAHESWSQIADTLSKPRSPIAQSIDGLANLFTAAMCRATKGQPTNVCKSKAVRAAGKRLA